jgi:hypothetical protein
MLWEQRALFDIFQNNMTKVQIKPSVFIRCSYCGENVSTKGKRNNRTTERHGANLYVSNRVRYLTSYNFLYI